MTAPEDLPYKLKKRELIAETNGLRVQILAIAPGKKIPWHYHTEVTDTFFCLEGPMVVETRDPDGKHILDPGGTCVVPVGVPHVVSGLAGGSCRFAIVQGIGEHDFILAEDD
ncbi:MAG: cupin domain-containing protein [Alphaproteobacteria bacterium]|jgi:quercetin dioxygenase-like cupin family protein|nr:cupin domain-containing protein [Alphaproteobacteria bacterium]|tara:strand:- start:97 stop:432 length:336 start_codon:yes stop_codon:yes gene_type:complete